MKIQARQVEAFVKKPDARAVCILVYGPDSGLISENATQLARSAVDDLSDPFRVVEFEAKLLKDDPARLSDEAAAMSFGGGRRVVRIHNAADSFTTVFRDFLADPLGDSLVVVSAGELGPRSSLRALFETAPNAAAVPCYSDDVRALSNLAREMLAKKGLRIDRDALSLLLESLGSDRAVSRSEINKLILYKGDNPSGDDAQVSVADVRASVGDSAALSLDDIAFAVGGGDLKALDRALTRAAAEGLHGVAIVRATSRFFQRLHQAVGFVRDGENIKSAMKKLRPPVIFMHEAPYGAAIQAWRAGDFAEVFAALNQAEIDCKTTGMPAEAATGRALLRIAQMSRRLKNVRR